MNIAKNELFYPFTFEKDVMFAILRNLPYNEFRTWMALVMDAWTGQRNPKRYGLYRNGKLICHDKQTHLAKKLGISKRTLQRDIRDLEKRGWVKIKPSSVTDGQNMYELGESHFDRGAHVGHSFFAYEDIFSWMGVSQDAALTPLNGDVPQGVSPHGVPPLSPADAGDGVVTPYKVISSSDTSYLQKASPSPEGDAPGASDPEDGAWKEDLLDKLEGDPRISLDRDKDKVGQKRPTRKTKGLAKTKSGKRRGGDQKKGPKNPRHGEEPSGYEERVLTPEEREEQQSRSTGTRDCHGLSTWWENQLNFKYGFVAPATSAREKKHLSEMIAHFGFDFTEEILAFVFKYWGKFPKKVYQFREEIPTIEEVYRRRRTLAVAVKEGRVPTHGLEDEMKQDEAKDALDDPDSVDWENAESEWK